MKEIVSLCFVLASLNASAEWVLIDRVDSMTDERELFAQTTNEEGHELIIYESGGTRFARFILNPESFDQISSARQPIYRIDKQVAVDLEEEKLIQDLFGEYTWEPKSVTWLIQRGVEKGESMQQNVLHFVQGQKLVMRYYVSSGATKYKETEFDLSNASPSITTAFGIGPNIDNERQSEYTAVRNAATDQRRNNCRSFQEDKKCYERINSCQERYSHDLMGFQGCTK